MTKRGAQTTPAEYVRQGFTCHQAGDFHTAEKFYRRALKRDKRNADALYLLGSLQVQTGALPQAEKTLKLALKAQPGRPEAQFNLARVYMQTQRFADAEPLLMDALAADSQSLSVLGSLGVVRLNQGNFRGAIDVLERAVKVDPSSAEAWCDLGTAYSQGDDDEGAERAFEHALAVDPGHARARHNRSHLRLRQKSFETGWPDYEARRVDQQAGFVSRPFDLPEWSGEVDGNQKVLVWGEQGLGDQILQASMLPDVIAKADEVIVECEPRLAPLFARSFPKATVVGTSLPPNPEIIKHRPTQQCASGSLGQWFRRSETSFPSRSGFLLSDPERTQRIKSEFLHSFGNGKRVGLSWKSSRVGLGPHKSADLVTDFTPIFKSASGVHFVSLQYGDTEADRRQVETDCGIKIHKVDNVDVTKDMDGLAALISALDLVITTSNTTAHLAGALGIPTWVLIPRGPARLWYWFDGDHESLWYPSLFLYWQDIAGDWSVPVQKLAGDFNAWCKEKVQS